MSSPWLGAGHNKTSRGSIFHCRCEIVVIITSIQCWWAALSKFVDHVQCPSGSYMGVKTARSVEHLQNGFLSIVDYGSAIPSPACTVMTAPKMRKPIGLIGWFEKKEKGRRKWDVEIKTNTVLQRQTWKRLQEKKERNEAVYRLTIKKTTKNKTDSYVAAKYFYFS